METCAILREYSIMHWQYNSLGPYVFWCFHRKILEMLLCQILRRSYNIYLVVVTFSFHLKKNVSHEKKKSQINFFCQNLRRQNNYIVKNNNLYYNLSLPINSRLIFWVFLASFFLMAFLKRTFLWSSVNTASGFIPIFKHKS